MKDFTDDHLRVFAKQLEHRIASYGDTDDITQRQKEQVEGLVEAEVQFRRALIASPHGEAVYQAFVAYILDERRNVLAARPYFRERQKVFTASISAAIRSRNPKQLHGFHFNWNFVRFATANAPWAADDEVMVWGEKIKAARHELTEINLPLAISRARLFWKRTQKSHLTYMDLIQIATEGLLAAIDKFCLPYSPVFRAVAIGRMTGNFIDDYSETTLHFYPTDKRKIYRANKIVHKHHRDGVDYKTLSQSINDCSDDKHKTNPDEIASLLSAISCVSADTSGTEDDEGSSLLSRSPGSDETRPDRTFERESRHEGLQAALERLTVFERKLLALKGL